ncbi:MAG TPA: PTS sugar transporter subunit IIB [Longimicrobiales bacterium]|nr:PTS sugar transporter subunit IIB [Longimicrobiales bacterium]
MPIVLWRVDERLIHGQVVLGWGSQLRPSRYIVVDDDLANSQWEQELYRLGAGDAEVIFRTVAAARDEAQEWRDSPIRSILLTRDVRSMRLLGAEGLLRGERVNLGGQHHGPERVQILTYLHLSPADQADLMALAEEGADVSARDLPDAHKVSLKSLIA